ncbi:CG7091 [Drosophila busckii]|uniref:CG7091 n=1 Tax=Drosophila busckii TaxID=30019 RepID=A0A0M4ET33_DROBS|nr:sialin [Drosophila busckii]ALC45930.1 CG7091 [Drosophila busckii]
MVHKSWSLPRQLTTLEVGATAETVESSTTNCRLFGSARLTYTLCAFFYNALQMGMRNMLGLIILRMVMPRQGESLVVTLEQKLFNLTDITPSCKNTVLPVDSLDVAQSGDLPWTRSQELTFPGTFYYGFVVALPLAGLLADRFGGKKLFINSMALNGLTYIALPLLAHHSYAVAVSILVISGLCTGCGNPPLYQLFVVWAHPEERTTLLSFAYSGNIIGTMCIYPLANYLSDYGWRVPFYVLGATTLLFAVLCNWLVYNSLDEHPRLSAAEKAYLLSTQQLDATQNFSIPWTALLTSMPVYAFVLTHIFHSYGFLLVALVLPRFMREAMQYNMKEIGLLASAPFLGSLLSKFICVLSCAFIERSFADYLNGLRRLLYVICNIVAIICIGAIIYASCEQKTLVLMMFVVLGAFADLAFSAGYWPSLLYIAPSFSGLLSGLANCLAHLSGFLAPILISSLVHIGLKAEWDFVLLSLIVFNVLGILVFGFFGSSSLQSWDPRSQSLATSSSPTTYNRKTQN